MVNCGKHPSFLKNDVSIKTSVYKNESENLCIEAYVIETAIRIIFITKIEIFIIFKIGAFKQNNCIFSFFTHNY